MGDRVNNKHGIQNEPALKALNGSWKSDHSSPDELGYEPVRAGENANLYAEGDPNSALGDEPALLAMNLDKDTAPGYAEIFQRRKADSTQFQKWLAVLTATLVAGPFAFIGAFLVELRLTVGTEWYYLLVICLFAPLIEEILKVSGVLYLAEQKPWLIPNNWIIPVSALISGLIFATAENFWYLLVLIPDADQQLVEWRWIVCTLLHVTASFIAGLGVARIYNKCIHTKQQPRVSYASGYLIAAVVLHTLYNTSVTIYSIYVS